LFCSWLWKNGRMVCKKINLNVIKKKLSKPIKLHVEFLFSNRGIRQLVEIFVKLFNYIP